MRLAIAVLVLLLRLTAFAAVIAISSGLFVQDMRLRWLGSLRHLLPFRLGNRNASS